MSDYVVSIDPGKHACSVAVWFGETLMRAAYIENILDSKTDGARWLDLGAKVGAFILSQSFDPPNLVLEVPEIYPGVRKEDPNDLIQLAGVLGAICGYVRGSVVWCPHPKQWKGQLPKKVSQARVEGKLTDQEKARIIWPKANLRHNVYDAIHLGLVYLKR